MSLWRRWTEAAGRLHAILGVPGLIIGLFSIISFGFGLVVLARENDRFRVSGREALRPILAGWVRSIPVHYLGWTLPDEVDRYRRSPLADRASRLEFTKRALARLGEELDRTDLRAPLVLVVSMDLCQPDGRTLASWNSRTSRPVDSSVISDRLPLLVADGGPPWTIRVSYRLRPEIAKAGAELEASYHRLVLAVTGLSGYSLLCLAYMVIQARSLRDRAAREAAQSATLDLADRTCHELGNVAFVLANERANLAHHLDLVDRFVAEEEDALRSAASRAGLDPVAINRLVRTLRLEYGRRGLDPAVEVRSGAGVARDVCRQIAVCSDYISLTVRELDAYLKQSSLPLAIGRINLHACLDDALALLAPTIDASSAVIRREGEDRVHARGDCRLLIHTLVNLVKNAIEAAVAVDRRPEIVASVRTEAETAVIELADNGPGIAAKALRRIFDNGYSTKGPGRGHGLAIARESIEAQGGELTVESQVGRGTRFRIELPVSEE